MCAHRAALARAQCVQCQCVRWQQADASLCSPQASVVRTVIVEADSVALTMCLSLGTCVFVCVWVRACVCVYAGTAQPEQAART